MSNTISKIIEERVRLLPEGSIITYSDFDDLDNTKAVAMKLSRLKSKSVIKRLEKGKYYKPKETKFGVLGPTDNSILEELLKTDGVRDSYISGVAAYNKLGLTTQVPNEITIVGDRWDRKTKIGKLRIKYVKAKTPINKTNIKLLQILDAINDIKKIPDSNIMDSLITIKNIIFKLNTKQKKQILSLSQYYRPRTQAIIGEILQEDGAISVEELRDNLNPLTKYKLNVTSEILPYKALWNIE